MKLLLKSSVGAFLISATLLWGARQIALQHYGNTELEEVIYVYISDTSVPLEVIVEMVVHNNMDAFLEYMKGGTTLEVWADINDPHGKGRTGFPIHTAHDEPLPPTNNRLITEYEEDGTEVPYAVTYYSHFPIPMEEVRDYLRAAYPAFKEEWKVECTISLTRWENEVAQNVIVSVWDENGVGVNAFEMEDLIDAARKIGQPTVELEMCASYSQ